MSIGRIINNLCDTFLPDCVGDAIGAAVDGAMGNWAGMALNTADLVEDVLDAAGADEAAALLDMAVDVAAMFVGGGAEAGMAGAAGGDAGWMANLGSADQQGAAGILAQLTGELRV